MASEERCVMCGATIPEGRQTCPECEHRIIKRKAYLDKRYNIVRRGEVYIADLNPVVGSESGGVCPVVIIQNDAGNKYSPTVIAAIASRSKKTSLPVHVELKTEQTGLTADTVFHLEQIRTLDKRRLRHCIGELDKKTMKRINKAAKISIGLKKSIWNFQKLWKRGKRHDIQK